MQGAVKWGSGYGCENAGQLSQRAAASLGAYGAVNGAADSSTHHHAQRRQIALAAMRRRLPYRWPIEVAVACRSSEAPARGRVVVNVRAQWHETSSEHCKKDSVGGGETCTTDYSYSQDWYSTKQNGFRGACLVPRELRRKFQLGKPLRVSLPSQQENGASVHFINFGLVAELVHVTGSR